MRTCLCIDAGMVSVVEASCVVGSVLQDGEVPGHVA